MTIDSKTEFVLLKCKILALNSKFPGYKLLKQKHRQNFHIVSFLNIQLLIECTGNNTHLSRTLIKFVVNVKAL